ncbi:DNA-directed primase/polymerase protein [Orussus abietinus]|uniref:DNA-directed primase/polymerase protein n=1 Tax=Orussus abietinus TaxID=222816 RepID=UPI00062507D3|nr:DNA-directed primase/polymerase protein [Orussus abietinus]
MESLKPIAFYGEESKKWEYKPYWKTLNDNISSDTEPQTMPQSLTGPTQFWSEFCKQIDALICAKEHSTVADLLCTFVYQNSDGYRKFVVAHPEVYWWYYKKMKPERKCSYEVIPEGHPCRAYFDLEFNIDLNPTSNGERMTATFIDIFCAYMLKYWGLPCDKTNVLNLDSTTEQKFSRHLIFAIKDIAFKDNLHLGRFIKKIHHDIIQYVQVGTPHVILNSFEKCEIEKLIIETPSGKKTFIDIGVYTRNRHFRIYQSSKWGKQSYLTLSSDCAYVPDKESKDKELNIFLNSLISYLPNTKDLILLEFNKGDNSQTRKFTKDLTQRIISDNPTTTSKYPILDNYILKLIYPGKIRACKYIKKPKAIIYEIYGFRYCNNIKRQHKSNNIYYVVDLETMVLLQKCHDEDCAMFSSDLQWLPPEISFQIDEENDSFLSTVTEDVAEFEEEAIKPNNENNNNEVKESQPGL